MNTQMAKMTQLPSATQIIAKEENILRDNDIVCATANPELFKTVYIRCQTVSTLAQQVISSKSAAKGAAPQQHRPMYVNPKTQDYFDVENLALRFYSTH